MRVALLAAGDPDAAPVAEAVRAALAEAGHAATVVGARPWAPAEAALRRRGFTAALTTVPATVAALRRGRFEVAHAFSATDALAARAWRRAGGGPVVCTCVEVLDRGRLADRRQRARLLAASLEDSDALATASEDARAALWRWMAIEAPVAAPDDVAAHEALYRRALARGR